MTQVPQSISLADKFAAFSEHWSPKIIAELNGQQVKIAKLLGEFDWHSHADEDELFLVVKGSLVIRFRTHDVRLEPGEVCVIPRGIEHCPVAEKEVEVVLFEPATTLNTGNVRSERTVDTPERL